MTHCPCGSETDYADCCGKFIEQGQLPDSPEQLMRSRYTAYTQANIDYIAQTMQGPAAQKFDPSSARAFAERAEWRSLEIIETSGDATIGYVEFLAQFMLENKRHVLHERSEFHFDNGRWYYYDGVAPKAPQNINVTRIGRNEACMCGSGKKYKKCCGVAI